MKWLGMVSRLGVFAKRRARTRCWRDNMEEAMRYEALIAGTVALALSGPALAGTASTLGADSAPSAAMPDVIAQGYPVPPPSYPQAPPPAYPSADLPPAPPTPPASPAALAPTPPPPPEVEAPPPAPSPSYVWEPGHWYWNGLQYHWQPGTYIEKPTTTATYKPGHWEERPDGWMWVASQWTYRTQ